MRIKMPSTEIKKTEKLNEILFAIKFAALVFSAVAYFRYFIQELPNTQQIYITNAINASIIFMILGIAFALWLFFDFKGKQSNRIIYLIAQPIVFIIFFMGAIILTGSYKSNFKYLFLFLILSYTIEWGIESGLFIATISSAIILGMDLLLVPKNGVNYFLEDDLILIGLFFIVAITVGHYVKLEKDHISKLNSLVNKDALTGLYNHRYFHEYMKYSIKNSISSNKPLSLMICDMDYFKNYNDIHGHCRGDNLLKSVADFFKKNLDEKYLVFRYGGDEFSIILPDVSKENAIRIAEQLRIKFSENVFSGQEYMPKENLTLSIGLSTFNPIKGNKANLLQEADEALYKAKYFRKNRVEAYVSLLDELKLSSYDKSISENVMTSIKTLISVINSRDQFTYSHLQRVVSYCRIVAEDFNLTEEEKQKLCYAAYVHDIGKIDVSKDIMTKTGKLTDEEWAELKQHPKIGAELVKGIDSLKDIAPIVLQHHERYDGQGYPNKLKEKEISYLARILIVVDSFDAMTSERPYQIRKTYKEGIEELRRCSNSQFDPEITEIFIKAIATKNFSEYNLLS